MARKTKQMIIDELRKTIDRLIDENAEAYREHETTKSKLTDSKRDIDGLEHDARGLTHQISHYEREREELLTFLQHGLRLLRPHLLEPGQDRETDAFGAPDVFDAPIDRFLTDIRERVKNSYFHGQSLDTFLSDNDRGWEFGKR